MKPALSIVVFTVFSGGGLGLAAWLAVFAERTTNVEFVAAAAAVLVFTGSGLLASVFHLANPKNAWRAFARARTSWLSREAILAALFFPLFAGWALAHAFADGGFMVLRIVAATWALATVFCTAMIYQSLKPIAAWHTPLTSFNYLMCALQSGAVLLLATESFSGSDEQIALYALLSAAAATTGKILHYRRLGATQDIRTGRATGFSRAGAKMLEAGHTAPMFLTREFMFFAPASLLRRLRAIALSIMIVAPATTAFFALHAMPWPAIASTLLLFAGLLVERWLFFAEARHSIRAYYGGES